MSRIVALLLAALFLVPTAASAAENRTRAGVAVMDATWHVGASAGQFSDDTGPVGADGIDPHGHSTKKRISDGVAVRTSVRALVVEDTQGDRVAIVSQDLYLAQDLLQRRVGQLLAEHDRNVALGLTKGSRTGITGTNLAMTASHNHNTPYYSTPGWGTAIFQDVYDLRFYDYMARQMARAVIKASKRMVPVRMGGATREFNEITSHTYGPKVADDGTPAGQPYDHTTGQLSVVRFDDVSDPSNPKPFANWVVFGLHPEFSWGYDLINGEFSHAAARMIDRELGTTSVFSQRETGASGPHKDLRVHQPEDRREFQDNGFNQQDRGAKLLAEEIKRTLADIETGTPERDTAYQGFVTDFDVASVSMRFAPPATRPYPGVSNCNTAALFHGDPRLPILGLPDCESTGATAPLAPTTGPLYEQLKQAGVPIPESYSPTKLTAVEETAAVHLMAMRLGDIGITFCPCEQFSDTALNIESRLDKVEGNLYDGWDWTEHKTPADRDWCEPVGGQSEMWTCANPGNPAQDLPPISDLLYRRMRAQIHNDAAGWETDLATLGSEAEPYDTTKIKGNFTKEELDERGYSLVLSVGMTNDYWGYTPEYREMRSHDHYRKALNGLGPHGADYLATRLSRMAASLKGRGPVQPSALDLAFTAEQARAEALAAGLGEAARAYGRVYERQLPADGGKPGVAEQPSDIERFAAAHVRFVGGSNYTDLPDVRVQRRTAAGKWVAFGDLTGDVQLMVDFPKPGQLADWRAGTFQWRWTAAFEAFASDISQPDARGNARRATPAGIYRFVIRGRHRSQAGAKPALYKLVSDEFTVAPWDGISVEDPRVEDDGRVSFAAGPEGVREAGGHTYRFGPIDYPDRYDSPFRYLNAGPKLFTYGLGDPSRHQWYCPRCTFRPWAESGDLKTAVVTVGGRAVEATKDADGRWRTAEALAVGESAHVAAGALRDRFGNTNGEASTTVTR